MKSRVKQLVLEKEVRIGERISQTEIAEATGLDNNTISRWMSPKPFQTISTQVALRLMRYFGVPFGDLFYVDQTEQESA